MNHGHPLSKQRCGCMGIVKAYELWPMATFFGYQVYCSVSVKSIAMEKVSTDAF